MHFAQVYAMIAESVDHGRFQAASLHLKVNRNRRTPHGGKQLATQRKGPPKGSLHEASLGLW